MISYKGCHYRKPSASMESWWCRRVRLLPFREYRWLDVGQERPRALARSVLWLNIDMGLLLGAGASSCAMRFKKNYPFPDCTKPMYKFLTNIP